MATRTSGCELCLYDKMEEYEKDFSNKRATVAEIVESLKQDNIPCTIYKFYNHMRNHLSPEVAMIFSKHAQELTNVLVDKIAETVKNFERVNEKLEVFHSALTAESEPAQIKAYTGLLAEARKIVESLAKLQGEVQGSSHIHVNNLNLEYHSVVEQILQDVCQTCKVKLSKTLEPLIAKATTTYG